MKVDMNFYLDHIRHLRRVGCLTVDSGAACDHALHLGLLVEEQTEYFEAHGSGNLAEKADALADTVTVACGYILDAGDHQKVDMVGVIKQAERAALADRIDLAGAFALVCESNLSKLCTVNQILPTREKYAKLGVELEFRDAGHGLWSAFAANSSGDIPKGKWLKGVGFREPNWKDTWLWML